MYWLTAPSDPVEREQSDWEECPQELCTAVVAGLNRRLEAAGTPDVKGGEDAASISRPLIYSEHTQIQGSAETLQVQKVRRKRLNFYPEGWYVYRLDCSIDAIPSLAGYRSPAALFAVNGPDLEPDDWMLLDWTNPPIHQLNRKLGLDFSTLGHIRDYLIFFCSFLGGDSDPGGPIPPFLLPSTANALAWAEAVEDLEEVAERRHLQLFKPVHEPNQADEFDLPELKPSGRDEEPSHGGGSSRKVVRGQSKHEAVEKAFADLGINPTIEPKKHDSYRDLLSVPDSAPAENRSGTFYGLVWYKDALFAAKFEVHKDGMVEMLNDRGVVDATVLPVPRWEVQHRPLGIRLLCLQQKREEITAAELLTRIEEHIKEEPKARALRRLRVGDEFRSSQIFAGPVRLEDVEFVEEVILDDSVFNRSLDLVGCRFLRLLSARDATIKGALRLDRSRIDGAIEKEGGASKDRHLGRTRPKPVLELRGLKVERGLFADRLIAFGRLRAEWTRIGGTLRARGLQMHPREGADDGDTALNLSHTQIDGPLDLSGYVPKMQEPGGRQRTVLGGTASLVGLRARQVDLRGIRVNGRLDLASCIIDGRTNLGILHIDREPEGKSWRARIANDLTLERAETGLVEMNGCYVGGHFYLVELQLAGSLFARLEGRYRTRVGDDLVASGAVLRGGIELDGAQIGGEIHYVTGKCGRLAAGVDVWWEEVASGGSTPRLCGTEASGIVLQDVEMGAGIALTGIKLHGRKGSYASGGIIAHGVRLGGGLGFWRLDAAERIRQQILKGGRSQSAPEDAVKEAIRTVRAEIWGSLDLRGIRTGGTLDLGRSKIGGNVWLDNARIDSTLRANVDDEDISCSVAAFSADIAQIGGDVDLRGLRVLRGDLRARDIEITGKLLLATQPEKVQDRPPRPYLRLSEGMIDLEGARATRLILSSSNLDRRQWPPETAAISLARCRFGQLTILGFDGRKKFRQPINLLAAEVGDWDIDPATEALPLLRATTPFDGRNYIDVEQRLAKIGYESFANKIYRSMTRRGAKRSRWRRVRVRANWLFAGNGTVPLLMFLWLVGLMVPVTLILANAANVEVASSPGENRPAVMASDGRQYDLDRDWGWLKAIGLAAGYAVPFYGGARSDMVRARLIGDTCLWLPAGWPGPWPMVARPASAASATAGRSARCEEVLAGGVSPHGVAVAFSFAQFVLWIFIAANLPAIARRRS